MTPFGDLVLLLLDSVDKEWLESELKQPPFLVGKGNCFNMKFVHHVGRCHDEISRLLFMWEKASFILLVIIFKISPKVPHLLVTSYFHDVCYWQNQCSVYCV